MGNIVAGEALRLWAVGHANEALVKSYVAMQAAITAGAYGDLDNDAQYPGQGVFVNDFYRNYPSGDGQTGNHPVFENTRSAATTWVNMYNAQDNALLWWSRQNAAKPLVTDSIPSQCWQWWYRAAPNSGGRRFQRGHYETQIISGEVVLRFVSDGDLNILVNGDLTDSNGLNSRYEVLAFCASGNSLALGTKPVLAWFGANNVDIQNLGLTAMADERPNHSFQFRHSADVTWQFYAALKQRTGFSASY